MLAFTPVDERLDVVRSFLEDFGAECHRVHDQSGTLCRVDEHMGVVALARPAEPRIPRRRGIHPIRHERGTSITRFHVLVLDVLQAQPFVGKHIEHEKVGARPFVGGNGLAFEVLDGLDRIAGDDTFTTS